VSASVTGPPCPTAVSVLPSQLLTVKVLRRPVESAQVLPAAVNAPSRLRVEDDQTPVEEPTQRWPQHACRQTFDDLSAPSWPGRIWHRTRAPSLALAATEPTWPSRPPAVAPPQAGHPEKHGQQQQAADHQGDGDEHSPMASIDPSDMLGGPSGYLTAGSRTSWEHSAGTEPSPTLTFMPCAQRRLRGAGPCTSSITPDRCSLDPARVGQPTLAPSRIGPRARSSRFATEPRMTG
jgi:hypothetical protein